ncbi:MAG: thioredoxin family protein [Thermoprotei archaeon]|nr:thioredoxin family protein [Thermoprotei archaeon]
MPGPGSPNGIYVYDSKGRVWKVLRAKGEPFKLGELGDGLYMVYFDNLYCPACRSQDHHIYKLVSRYGGKPNLFFVVILCDWFADNCASEAASRTFREFKVSASPTILVASVRGSEISQERLEGVRNDSSLEYYVKKFLEIVEGPSPPS